MPNLARLHGSSKFTEYVANPEKQPPATAKNESIFKIEIDPGTYPDIDNFDDPFSTVAKIPGGYAHFINAAKYGQTPDETWKNEWVKLKITLNIPGIENYINKIPKDLGVWLYYEDPDLDDSWDSPPSNPNDLRTVEFDPSGVGVGKDNIPESTDPLSIPNMLANDQATLYQKDSAGFNINNVETVLVGPNSAIRSLYISRDEYLSLCNYKGELTAYFRTGKYGGNNYKIKAIVGVPSCFMWDDIDTINVWTKYTVFVSTIKGTVPNIQANNPSISSDYWNIASKNLKGGFDDGFAYVIRDKNDQTKAYTHHETSPTYVVKPSKISTDCKFQERSSVEDKKIVHNLHLAFYPFLIEGSDYDNKDKIITTAISDKDCNTLVISTEYYKKYFPHISNSKNPQKDWSTEMAATCLHEFGHLIPYLSPQYLGHAPYEKEDPNIMNYSYCWDDLFPGDPYYQDRNNNGKLESPSWFSRKQILIIRSMTKGQPSLEFDYPGSEENPPNWVKFKYGDIPRPLKYPGYFIRRTQP